MNIHRLIRILVSPFARANRGEARSENAVITPKSQKKMQSKFKLTGPGLNSRNSFQLQAARVVAQQVWVWVNRPHLQVALQMHPMAVRAQVIIHIPPRTSSILVAYILNVGSLHPYMAIITFFWLSEHCPCVSHALQMLFVHLLTTTWKRGANSPVGNFVFAK